MPVGLHACSFSGDPKCWHKPHVSKFTALFGTSGVEPPAHSQLVICRQLCPLCHGSHSAEMRCSLSVCLPVLLFFVFRIQYSLSYCFPTLWAGSPVGLQFGPLQHLTIAQDSNRNLSEDSVLIEKLKPEAKIQSSDSLQ